MIGLRDLIILATNPDDCPARREARELLYILAGCCAVIMASPFLAVWAFWSINHG